MENKSFTLAAWCAHRAVSRSMFYKLKSQGLAPRIHRVGDKVLVSALADRDWLAEREAAAQVEAA